ncbi:MAG: hypothetical protein LQ350_003774 [Teloschistes chrysophthalmus]|nr:MAG: hypothetical protein LQ350_003774 [Niorma chrysophthalma]
MTSPTRSLRRSPPRRPLHERSDSKANERPLSASRLSTDLEKSIYKNTPFPTHPSHVLSPKHASRSGLAPRIHEDHGGVPAQENSASRAAFRVSGLYDRERREDVQGQDTEKEARNSVRPLSIGNATPIAVPPLNFHPPPHPLNFHPPSRPSRTSIHEEDIIEWGNQDSRPLLQLPSFPSLPDINEPSVPATKAQGTSDHQPVNTKSSEASLSSSESTGTIVRHKVRLSRGSYSAFPPVSRPSSSKSGGSPSTPQRAFPSSSDDGVSISPVSASSATFQSPETQELASTPVSRPHRAVSDVVNFQFPAIRQPSATGSYAETSGEVQDVAIPWPQRKPERIYDRYDRWNPHLSTVPSEITEERGSESLVLPNSASMSTSSLDTNQLVPAQQKDMTGSTIRVVDESDDNVSNLLPTIPGSRGSAFYSVLSGGSRSKRKSAAQPRPTSKGSFFRDSIPAWAKVYYARSSSALALPAGRQDANPSVSSESLDVRRTRPKPKVHIQNPPERDSLAIETAQPHGTVLAEIPGGPRQNVSQIWSPHLWQDRRRLARRRSVFRAPSLDSRVEGPFGRRNAQVLLFTIGFIFPLAWFLASMLPLPQKAATDSEANLGHELEKPLDLEGEARYENARWWRNLNRLMCIVGVLVIAAIIALAVVAVRIRN